jgi:hypothetical protein
MKELTILMPCLDEAETVVQCVTRARAYLVDRGLDGEVLVADNGSTDGSRALAMAAGARVVTISERGYGAALRGGIAAATGRYVVMADADCSYDFMAIDPFLAELRAGVQLVMGNRFRGGIAAGAMPPLHRFLGNPVLSGIGRLLFRAPVRDFHCGMRGFDRVAMDGLGLTTSGMEFASEMVVRACLQGLSISEVPTTLQPDGRSRPPHLDSWRDGWRHLRFLVGHSRIGHSRLGHSRLGHSRLGALATGSRRAPAPSSVAPSSVAPSSVAPSVALAAFVALAPALAPSLAPSLAPVLVDCEDGGRLSA